MPNAETKGLAANRMVLHLGTFKPILRTGGKVFRPKLDILPTPQQLLWPQLGTVPRNFVLYGGTALALRLGHRKSIDFDFFSNDPFEPSRLLSEVGFLRESRVDQRGNNTLSVLVDKSGPVRLSFFGDVGMSRVHDPDLADNSLQIASLLDLTATKLKTIQQRAEAKDYQDVAAALRAGIKLEEALAASIAVFGRKFNAIAALKALTYFEDGNLRSMPAGLQKQLLTAASAVDLDSLPEVIAKPGIVRQEKEA